MHPKRALALAQSLLEHGDKASIDIRAAAGTEVHPAATVTLRAAERLDLYALRELLRLLDDEPGLSVRASGHLTLTLR